MASSCLSLYFCSLKYQVSAVDLDPLIIKRAVKLAHNFKLDIKFIQADSYKLPFSDNSFDVVFHQGFLEHFSNKDIYRHLDEHLRVGRTVVFSVPNNFYPKLDFGNERLLSKNYWERLLGKRYQLLISKNYPKKHIFLKYFNKTSIIELKNAEYLAKIEYRK